MSIVSYESREGIALITFDRPEGRNSLNGAACDALHGAWKQFAESDDRVAVLSATGPNFCTGADLKDLPDNILMCMPNLAVPCDKPIICAVGGWAVGAGATIAMMADMVVAAEDARFMYPEAKVGAFAGLMGGFPSRMPYKVGLEWALTGDPMSAQRAYEIGFVNKVCAPGEQLALATALAARIAANAPLVVTGLKSLAQQTLAKGPVETAFANGLMLQAIRASQDCAEGVAAMNAKRKPQFVGR